MFQNRHIVVNYKLHIHQRNDRPLSARQISSHLKCWTRRIFNVVQADRCIDSHLIFHFLCHRLADQGDRKLEKSLDIHLKELNIFRSTAIPNTILYIYRMLAIKPLTMIIFDSMTEDKPIQLQYIFFLVHGSFITRVIFVNTASKILLTHSRVEFLGSAFVQKKFFYTKSVTEYAVWREILIFLWIR